MSSTNPPDPNVNTFNNLYWINSDAPITQAEADKRYLRFPTAQGTENLKAINVGGLATFNNDATFNENIIVADGVENSTISQDAVSNALTIANNVSTGAILFRTTNSSSVLTTPLSITSNIFNINSASTAILGAGTNTMNISSSGITNTKPITLSGAANTDRIINNVYYQLQDANSLATTTGQIYAGSGVFNYDNDANGGTHTFATNTAGGVQTIPLSFNSVDMTIATTNPPTCNASSTILLTDDSNKLPSTAWVRDYVTSVAPPSPVTLVSTASTTGYNAGGNYTYWYFTSYPTWAAYSWVFNTPKTSRTNVNKTGLGSSPPLNVGTIGANGSFLFMTGNGISQGYTATSSNMITYCNGYQENYTISAGATASILSIINCIGGTPASPFFQSNQLAENNGTCPPSAFGLSGYIVLQMLNGNYTGLGTPTITFTQIIA